MSIPGPTPAWDVTPREGLQLNSVAISADGSTVLTGTSQEYGCSEAFGVYCYAVDDEGHGTLLWQDPLGREADDGVFWVALSADGRWAAAAGSYGSGAGGFVRLYDVNEGPPSKREFDTSARVNEIELNADGSLAVACYADQVDCLVRVGSLWRVGDVRTFPGRYARSCGVNPDDGLMAVGGQIETNGTDETTESNKSNEGADQGFVTVLAWDGTSLVELTSLDTAEEVLRVVISGAFVAASTHGGTVSLWYPAIGPAYELAWTFSPQPELSLIYALAIAQTDTTVWIGGGGNATGDAAGRGGVFVIQSIPNEAGFTPTQLWSASTSYPPNPASYLDANATLLTAADGEPEVKGPETPGRFYLYDARTGELVWEMPTSLMNWGMRINSAGTACVGGSDDGTLYYWGKPAKLP